MEKTCKNCGTPITKEYCEDNYPEVCEHWSPKKPKTNADRIRAMSDEELAGFLEDEDWLCSTYNCCSACPMKGEGTKCLSVLEWLKQPAEVSL